MTVAHEAIAALPVLTPADKALIRAMCTRRFAYCLTAVESATNLVVVDLDTGTVPLYLIQNSTMFAYDSTDSTTAHDGVTCLVSSDGKRFKSGTIAPPYSVLTKGTVAQPGSPTVGDRYLIPTAATGTDWAGKDGKIGIYTAAGWRFAISPVGRFLYVEDETANYHRNTSGVWTAGVGSIVLGANSVNITNILGAKASFVLKVENATTNTPPGSPVAPVAYIIGSSPTGAWAGHTGALAVCLATGTFTIITPDVGDEVYNKALGINVQWTGTAWVSALGAWVGTPAHVFTDTGNFFISGFSGGYSFSATVAPTQSGARSNNDNSSINYTPKKSGAKLLLTYSASGVASNCSTVVARRDSDDTYIAWSQYSGASQWQVQFLITTTDALVHTYSIQLVSVDGNNPASVFRRLFTIQESSE